MSQDTQEKFIQIMQALQTAIPEGSEAQYSASGAKEGEDYKEKLLQLVPLDLRQSAFDEAMALSDNDAFACVNKVHQRSGIREPLHSIAMSFFSNSFWTPLFGKAANSETAKAKRAGGA